MLTNWAPTSKMAKGGQIHTCHLRVDPAACVKALAPPGGGALGRAGEDDARSVTALGD